MNDVLAYLKSISFETTNCKKHSSFNQLNADLQQIELSLLTDPVLVALLRNTWSFRHELDCWDTLFCNIEKLLLGRGSDVRTLMRGMCIKEKSI